MTATTNDRDSHLPESDEGEVGIDFVGIALRNKWLLASGIACGVVLGQLAYWQMGPSYEAKAQILVSRRHAVPLNERDRVVGDFGDRSEHLALIQSPMIAGEAVKIGKLDRLSCFAGDPDPAESIVEDLKVKRTSGQDRSFLNVFDLSYPAEKREDASQVVAAIIEAYSQYLDKSRQENTDTVVELTRKAHDELLGQLREAEQTYLAFRQSAPLQWRGPVGANMADGQNTTNVHQERVIAIEEQRRLNLVKLAEIHAKMKALKSAREGGESVNNLEALVRRLMASEGDTAEMRQREIEFNIYDGRMMPLYLQEQQLTRKYGADHPEVKAIRTAIAESIQRYRQQGIRLTDPVLAADGTPSRASVITLYEDTLRQQERELLIKNDELDAVFEQESKTAKEYARYQAQDQAMNAEVVRIRQLWEQLTDRLNKLGIEKDSSGYSLRQIAPIKTELSLKRWLKFLAMGVAACGGCIGLFVVLREWRQNLLQTPDDVRRTLRLPVIGTVCRFAESVQSAADRTLHEAVRYVNEPRSREAEQYRAIRTALQVAMNEQSIRVLQLTSPEPGDGKTTAVANLSAAMAQTGRKVLVIDADLRRPTLHHLLRVRGDVGLAEVLAGEVELENAVQSTVIENLSILAAGECPTNPAELLCSPRLERLIHDSRNLYDIVIVDGPPVLAVSDPCILAQHTDGILFVLRAGRATRRLALQARDILTSQGLKLIGTVVNGLEDDSRSDYGYYPEYQASDRIPESRTNDAHRSRNTDRSPAMPV